jgi:hypothetical protein
MQPLEAISEADVDVLVCSGKCRSPNFNPKSNPKSKIIVGVNLQCRKAHTPVTSQPPLACIASHQGKEQCIKKCRAPPNVRPMKQESARCSRSLCQILVVLIALGTTLVQRPCWCHTGINPSPPTGSDNEHPKCSDNGCSCPFQHSFGALEVSSDCIVCVIVWYYLRVHSVQVELPSHNQHAHLKFSSINSIALFSNLF